jgi:hypothetical protein
MPVGLGSDKNPGMEIGTWDYKVGGRKSGISVELLSRSKGSWCIGKTLGMCITSHSCCSRLACSD